MSLSWSRLCRDIDLMSGSTQMPALTHGSTSPQPALQWALKGQRREPGTDSHHSVLTEDQEWGDEHCSLWMLSSWSTGGGGEMLHPTCWAWMFAFFNTPLFYFKSSLHRTKAGLCFALGPRCVKKHHWLQCTFWQLTSFVVVKHLLSFPKTDISPLN